jgi:hypothetical protein
MPKDDLFSAYIHHANIVVGERRHQLMSTFGKEFKKMLPSVKSRQETVPVRNANGEQIGTRRAWCHAFPELEDCRRAFEDYIGHELEWAAHDDGPGERRANGDYPDDDEIPF